MAELEESRSMTPKGTSFASLIGQSNSALPGTPGIWNGRRLCTLPVVAELEESRSMTPRGTSFASHIGQSRSALPGTPGI